MAKNLQDLRREAGYRSAKDFAAATGIALSTYNRYENQPDAIPLKQAWAIADFLGCSIDMVVGREPVNTANMRGDFQKLYDRLSAEGRRMLDEYMEFVQLKDASAERRRRDAEHARYDALARRYIRMFWQHIDEGTGFCEAIGFDTADREREAFRSFVSDKAAESRRKAIQEHCEGLREEMEQGYVDEKGKTRHFLKAEIVLAAKEEADRMEAEQAPRDEEVIDRIMEAYDRLQQAGPLAPSIAVEYMGRP